MCILVEELIIWLNNKSTGMIFLISYQKIKCVYRKNLGLFMIQRREGSGLDNNFLCFYVLEKIIKNIYRWKGSREMQIDKYQYPVDWKKVKIHRRANMLSKKFLRGSDDDFVDYGSCEYCDKQIGYIPFFRCCADIKEDYSHHGPNLILYMQFTRKIIILMICFCLLFGIYALVANLSGTFCRGSEGSEEIKCLNQNILDHWSKFNISDDEVKRRIQDWFWCLISIIIIAFNIFLRLYSRRMFNQIDQQNITEADYSLILRELPENTTKEEIQSLIKDISEDVNQKNPGKNIDFSIKDIIQLKKTKKYSRKNTKNIEKFKESIKLNLNEQFRPNELPELNQPSNTAIVKFNSSYANTNIEIETTCKDAVINYFFPFYNLKSQYEIKGERIAIEPAPQPSDIIWNHIGYEDRDRIKKKLLYTFLAGLALAGSMGLGFGLAKWQNQIVAQLPDEIGAHGFTAFIFLLNYSFNLLIGKILYVATRKQKLDTYTNQKVELMQKFTFYKTINIGFFTLITPFLSHLPNLQKGIQSMDITVNVLLALGIDLGFGVFLNFILKYLRVKQKIYEYLIGSEWLIYTQSEANLQLEGPAVEYVDHYVFMLRLFLLSLIYSMISPICLFLGTIGLFIAFWSEKYFLARLYIVPEYGDYRLNSQFVDILDATPILIGVFGFFFKSISFFFQFDRIQIIQMVPIYINLGIGFIHFLLPWDDILKKFMSYEYYQDIPETFDQMEEQMEITYQSLNPETRIKKKIKQVEQQIVERIIKKSHRRHKRQQSEETQTESIRSLKITTPKKNSRR